jgi:hypothetical protein
VQHGVSQHPTRKLLSIPLTRKLLSIPPTRKLFKERSDEGNVRQRPHEEIFLLTSGARWFKVIPTTDEEKIKCQHEMITVS